MTIMKTIMISDETYQKLAAIKGKKSFTVLLSELAEKAKQTKLKDLERFFGIMSNDEAEWLEKFITDRRRNAKVRV